MRIVIFWALVLYAAGFAIYGIVEALSENRRKNAVDKKNEFE